MYKGKFDQKNKKNSPSVQEIVSQREATPVREAPRKKPAPQQTAPSAKAPAKNTPPRKQPQPEPPVKKKKGPRLGGVIFYTLYFLFILVFFLGTYLGLNWLNGWLADYEMAQPVHKAEQVFTQLFTDPDWSAMYDAAGAQDSPYEGKAQFVNYMEAKVGDTPLIYLETSAGLSGNKKYEVRLDDEKVATFTLVDKNNTANATLENITELPDWQLGAVEVFFKRSDSYYVQKQDGHTAYVNDVALTDDQTIQIATTRAEKYLPEGTTGASTCIQQVTGLMEKPQVTILDENGQAMEVTYDEATKTFIEGTSVATITPEQQEAALNAAKAQCLWMIEEGSRADIAKYYEGTSSAYKEIISITADQLWMQDHNGYEFADVSVTNFTQYTDDIFSVRITLNLNVTRPDNSIKKYPYASSLFLRKSSNGDWKVFEKTNVDVSQPVGKVRLTFMQGDILVNTDFYDTESNRIITPLITPIPEGQVFSGWVKKSENENGDTVLTVVFEPGEDGWVDIPEGAVLEPMVLYAWFQDAATAAADAAAEAAAETIAAETTEGGNA